MNFKFRVQIVLTLLMIIMCSFSLNANAEYLTKVIYFKSRQAEDIDRDKYEAIFRQIQDFFRDEMSRHGYGEKTIKYETDSDNRVKVHSITGKHEGSYYKGNTFHTFQNKISKEIPFSINAKRSWDAQEHHYIIILAGVPRIKGDGDPSDIGQGWTYGGGNRGGVSIINAQYELEMLDYYKSLIIHELAHTFDLRHTGLNEELMGPLPIGFPKYMTKENASILDKHRAFYVQKKVLAQSSGFSSQEKVILTFFGSNIEHQNTIMPINSSNEWVGYGQSIWEKTPDGQTTKKPSWFTDFKEIDVFNSWMYSHAPSTIVYDISKLQIDSFSTYFLLTHSGCHGSTSMQFIASIDGIEAYSKNLYLDDHGTHVEFDVPSQSQLLTLKIDPIGSKDCDHFVLAEPMLYAQNGGSKIINQETLNADVNNDGYVDLYDVMIVRSAMQNSVSYDTDVNNDGITNEVDLLIVKAKAMEAIAAASPRKRKISLTTWGAMKRK